MKTLKIKYEPGDVVEYRSKKFGIGTMEVLEVRVLWTKGNIGIKYRGYPKFEDNKIHGKTTISDLKNMKLIKKG